MQTVDKAMKLLNLFSIKQPEIGLSELSRMAQFDKAATRRLLVALQNHNFVEQDLQTKRYRLGSGFLRLAKIREATLPITSLVQPVLDRISGKIRETSHAALFSDQHLSTLAVSFPDRANRVHLDIAESLPLHATASGIVFMAYCDPQIPTTLPKTLDRYTANTITDHEMLNNRIKQAESLGYGVSENGYEDEVTGIAVPVFATDGYAFATLAIATPTSRMTGDLAQKIRETLFAASVSVTRTLGGDIPGKYKSLVEDNCNALIN